MDYESLVKKIRETDKAINDLKNQIPVKGIRDKCGLRFEGAQSYNMPEINDRKAFVAFSASHGQYGSSSSYSDMGPDLARFVLLALRDLEQTIISKAIEIAVKEKNAIAQNAKQEALMIIELSDS